jgi:hypothetical protein
MAKLTSGARSALPASSFALPQKRAFPIEDKVHAQKALQFLSRSVKAGNTTPAEAATVRSKAKAKLAGAPPSMKPRAPRKLRPAVDAIRNH